MHRRRIQFGEFMVPMEDTRLPQCVMFADFVGGSDCAGWQGKKWIGCFLYGLRAFCINVDQWTTAAQDEE